MWWFVVYSSTKEEKINEWFVVFNCKLFYRIDCISPRSLCYALDLWSGCIAVAISIDMWYADWQIWKKKIICQAASHKS